MESGFPCGAAGRIQHLAKGIAERFNDFDPSLPVETAWAKWAGWRVPSEEQMWLPRLYYWTAEKMINPGGGSSLPAHDLLLEQPQRDERLGFRFPLSLLTAEDCYPDGSFGEGVACYSLFPLARTGDQVVYSQSIEVRYQYRWFALADYKGI